MKMNGKYTPKYAAAEMSKHGTKVSEQFVRIGLQRGLLPFGFAVKMSSKYTYYINKEQLEAYLTAQGVKQ